ETRCLVYPAPAGSRPLPRTGTQTGRPGADEQGDGSEDFAGLRPYVAGDSPRRVAWRASAGSDELLVKCFSGQARPELWLDFEALAPLPVEERLSQLCQWLLLAEQQGLDYGLRLPGRTFPPAQGEQQRHRCLEALALFGLQPEVEAGGLP
ncbi:MAG TPA: DUF58 domain-containing protein, partial [Candidatus Competibacteraceae bacterium]|nr:DUF58 domain-containing protein [Candidatus Competibacteraceae bacterium]